jgi:hypothetical protein
VDMNKLPQQQIGFMNHLWVHVKGYKARFFGQTKKPSINLERERFEADVKEQFIKLKEKGLSIRVYTL